MALHKKPTKEELKAQEEAAIEEAEKLEETEENSEIEITKEPEETEEEIVEEIIEETKEEEPEKIESPEETPELKKKLSASARENQKIYAKNRVMNQAILDANDIKPPSDKEMEGIYGDNWELASDIEKESLRETQISKQWREKIKEASDQATKIEKWNDSVDIFVEDPKTLNDHPELEGKTEEFRAFAIEEANNSVPFKILVAAFLHTHNVTKPNNKGRMFEKGSGGPNDKPQPRDGSITLEEARKLRESNYGKYKEYLLAGKIKSDL